MDRRYISFLLVWLLSFIPFTSGKISAQAETYNSYRNVQDTILFDDFSGYVNQWLLGIEEGSWTETLDDGKLFFQSHTNQPKEDLIPVIIDTERDFEIETEISFSKGDLTKAFGLKWGKSKNQSKQYDFFIAANGHFTIDKYDNGFVDYVPFTLSDLVNRYAANKLTFRKVGDHSYFFLNEQLVHQMPFQPFYGNLTGIQVAENSTILVDYFKVVYLDKSENLLSKILIIDYTHSAAEKSWVRGMPIKLTVQLKNAGDKDATGLDISYRLPPGIEVLDFTKIRNIGAGQIEEMALDFFPTRNFSGDEIKIVFEIEGADITNAGDVDFVIHLDDPEKPAHDKSLEQTYSEFRGDDPLKGLNVAQALQSIDIGDYYALIIGIDEFRGEWPPLRNAVNDARSVQQLLEQKYQFQHIKTLYNKEATRQNILNEFEWFMNNVREKDNLLIYYSGHGYYNDQIEKGFWVPVDAETKQMHQYISNEEIRAFMSGIRTRHTLLISDACFSGDIFRGKTLSIPYENSTKYYHKVYSLTSRKAMTSGGVEPVLDGGRNGHSVFGYYLLKALEGNENKYLDAGELFNQIKIPIINNSEQTPIYNPVHDTGDEGGQFIFITK
ncbi:MAG: caspase family protein [Bacteroidota bacterium]